LDLGKQGKWNAEYGVRLIVVDTLSQSIGNNSINDDSAIRTAIRNLKKWIRGGKGKFSILVIAHSSYKNPAKGIMGSAILKNDFPTVLKIKKGKNNQMLLYREKMKCDAEGTSIPFSATPVIVEGVATKVIDIGKQVNDIEADILSCYENNLDKKGIKENLWKTYEGNYTTRKSFDVSFNRYWKNLIKQGFIADRKHGNIK